MKRKPLPDDFLVCGSIPPEERRAKLAQMLAAGAPPAAATVLVGKIPDADAEDPPPLPSLLDLVKRKFGLHIEHNAPEWAKRAAEMAFDSLTPQRRKRAASAPYSVGFDSGYLHGAAELLAAKTTAPPPRLTTPDSAGIRECDKLLKQQWAEQPSDQAADFFIGFRDGERLMRGAPERARQMAQRTKIYRAIATRWREIAPGVLHSTDQLHQWLLSQKAILFNTDSRETRQVCKRIGLHYRNPGRPRKQKTEPLPQS